MMVSCTSHTASVAMPASCCLFWFKCVSVCVSAVMWCDAVPVCFLVFQLLPLMQLRFIQLMLL